MLFSAAEVADVPIDAARSRCRSLSRVLLSMNCAMLITVALFLWGINTNLFGYPEGHGPFRTGQEPAAIARNQCELVRNETSPSGKIAGEVRQYRPRGTRKDQDQITVALLGTARGWMIEVRDAQGKSLMLAPATNSMTTSQIEVSSCELNQDGLTDFIVNVWSGGTGLAMDGSEVTLLLSSKEGYRATSFYLYSLGEKDLVQFKSHGPVYFILNDLISSDGEKTRDGRNHHFWVYELYRIDGTRLTPADADQPGFPKWVWYTNEDNHEETTQLSQEQKNRILKKMRTPR